VKPDTRKIIYVCLRVILLLAVCGFGGLAIYKIAVAFMNVVLEIP
jgi:hypothetical protein